MPAAPRPSPHPGRRSLALLAALLASAPALAVQLPGALLAEPAPLSLQPPPPLRPLVGLDGWRLYSVFSRGDGQGTASLSLDDTTLLTVQAGVRLPGGIEVLEVQRDRLLLRRGAQVGELVIQGRASRVAELSPGTVVAERAPVLPTLPAGCESFAQAGAPLDELQALGGCPQVNAP